MPQENKAPTRLQGVGVSGLAGVQRGLSADLFGLPVDAVANVADLGLAGYGTAVGLMGRQDLMPDLLDRSQVMGSGDWVAHQLSKAGALMGPVDSGSGADRAAFAFGRGGAGAAFGLRSSPKLAFEEGVRGGFSSVAAEQVGDISGNPALAASAAFIAGHGQPTVKQAGRPMQGGQGANLAPARKPTLGKTEWHKIIADVVARVLPETRASKPRSVKRDDGHDMERPGESPVQAGENGADAQSNKQGSTDIGHMDFGKDVPPAGTARHANPTKSNDNCANCVFVVNSLLKSGARASALPRSTGVPFTELETFFGTKFGGWTTRVALERKLLQLPEGTIAVVYGMDKTGSYGHVWNAVVQPGRINYIDGQAGSGGEANFQSFPSIQFGIIE